MPGGAEDLLEFRQVVRRGERFFCRDTASLHELLERLIEGVHPEVPTLFDAVINIAVRLAVLDLFFDRRRPRHHLDRGDATGPGRPKDEALRDDTRQRRGELQSDLLALVEREGV